MKRILLVAAIVSMSGMAMAGEITVKVSDQDQQAFANLPGAVDQCVAGLQLRGDAGMCRLVSQFAGEFSQKIAAAKPKDEPKPEAPGMDLTPKGVKPK